MNRGLTGKIVAAALLVSTLLGALHHHSDLKVHSDCNICTLQANMGAADICAASSAMPLSFAYYSPTFKPFSVPRFKCAHRLSVRAPPYIC